MHRFLAVIFSAVALCWIQGCCCPCTSFRLPTPNMPNIPNMPNVQTDGDGGSITFPTDEGEFKIESGLNVELPKEFPKDVPVYPGAKIVSSMNLVGNFVISMESGDPAEEIIAFYESKLKAEGWELTANMKTSDGASFVGLKNESKRRVSATVSIDKGRKLTTIELSTNLPEKPAESE